MEKQKCIEYLNSVRSYLNLTALCNEYNILYPNNTIDYNNLRNVINGVAPKRLSEDKLNSFISFLKTDIYQKRFLQYESSDNYDEKVKDLIETIVAEKSHELAKIILEALKNEL